MSLKRNTFWNLLGAALPLAVGAATVPYLINTIGVERFGVLTLLWAIVGYFGLFDFGLGRAITQRVAKALAEGQNEQIPHLAGTGITLTIYTGLGGAAILALAASTLATSTLNVSPALQGETFHALLLSAIAIPLTTTATAYRGMIEAYEDFKSSNLAKMFLGGSIFLFPAIGVAVFGPSLTNVAAWLLLSRGCALLAFILFSMRLPTGRVRLFVRQTEASQSLVSFSAWMAVSNLISPLLVYADRFIISHMLGAAVVAYYTVPFEFVVRLLIIPGAIGATLLPRLSVAYSTGSLDAGELVRKSLLTVGTLMGALALAAGALAYPLLHAFISPDFAARSWLIAVLLCTGVFFNSLAFIPYTALHARGIAKPTAIFHVCEFVIYVPVLICAVRLGDLQGAAAAWCVRTLIDFVALFYWQRRTARQSHVLADTRLAGP
jgi:O-antigen/teichoic acid export membrane protein